MPKSDLIDECSAWRLCGLGLHGFMAPCPEGWPEMEAMLTRYQLPTGARLYSRSEILGLIHSFPPNDPGREPLLGPRRDLETSRVREAFCDPRRRATLG